MISPNRWPELIKMLLLADAIIRLPHFCLLDNGWRRFIPRVNENGYSVECSLLKKASEKEGEGHRVVREAPAGTTGPIRCLQSAAGDTSSSSCENPCPIQVHQEMLPGERRGTAAAVHRA